MSDLLEYIFSIGHCFGDKIVLTPETQYACSVFFKYSVIIRDPLLHFDNAIVHVVIYLDSYLCNQSKQTVVVATIFSFSQKSNSSVNQQQLDICQVQVFTFSNFF